MSSIGKSMSLNPTAGVCTVVSGQCEQARGSKKWSITRPVSEPRTVSEPIQQHAPELAPAVARA